MLTNIPTAELTKYAANSFLATKISFINEFANLCEKIGGDVQAIARGIGLDGRIGRKFLHAGPGFGGSCFPKDTRSAAHFAREAGEALEIVEAVIRVNDRQRARMVEKIVGALGGELRGKTVALLGLSFKPETDDMRDAPSVDIVARPLGARRPRARLRPGRDAERRHACCPTSRSARTPTRPARTPTRMVLVTEWNQFRMLDLERVKRLLREPVVVDLRNVYEPEPMRAAGFRYVSVGR